MILSQPPAVPFHRRGRRRSSSGACAATDGPISHWPRPHGQAGKETQTCTDNSNTDRFSGAPKHRRRTIFRARPCAPCSSTQCRLTKRCSARSKGRSWNNNNYKKRTRREPAEDGLGCDGGSRVGWSRVEKVAKASLRTCEQEMMLRDEERGRKDE